MKKKADLFGFGAILLFVLTGFSLASLSL